MYFSNLPLPPDHLGSILLSEVFYYMYNFLSVKHNSMNSILQICNADKTWRGKQCKTFTLHTELLVHTCTILVFLVVVVVVLKDSSPLTHTFQTTCHKRREGILTSFHLMFDLLNANRLKCKIASQSKFPPIKTLL